jgi:glutamine amidotransferase-like uncharacterized protein
MSRLFAGLLRPIALFYLITLLIPLSPLSSPSIVLGDTYSESSRTDLTGINVAVYNGTSALPHSAIALKNMFDWMNATTIYVDADGIKNAALESCDILVYPGGSTLGYSYELEEEGRELVKDFVASGGSYFGICGGSLFGTNAGLGLFNGSYSGAVSGTGTYLMDLTVNRSSTGPDLSSEPENYTTLYWGSSYFYGAGMADAIPIMTYQTNGEAAMVVCRYELGTVFLSSPHPEYEEGDARDGTSIFDDLNDPDSEWGLLLKVSIWLVEVAGTELPVTTTTTTDGSPSIPTDSETSEFPFIIAALSIGMVAIVVVLLRRR